MRIKSAGITLVQLALLLSVMTVVVATIVMLAHRAIEDHNVKSQMSALSSINAAMTSTYRSKSNYPPIGSNPELENQLTQSLISANKLTAKELINALNGYKNSIISVKFGQKEHSGFGIKVTNLTENQCKKLITTAYNYFPYIEIYGSGEEHHKDMEQIANGAEGWGVIKSISGGIPLNLQNPAQTEWLCVKDNVDSINILFANR